jgi:hypothetical protein
MLEISVKESEESLFKHKSSVEYLKLYEFLDLDWSLNQMLQKMRDALALQEDFLSLVHNKGSLFRELHESVLAIQATHLEIDRQYASLNSKSFKFTKSHLLPYAYFKNQTQNDVKSCNTILKLYRHKHTGMEKVFEKFSNEINNSNIEDDSVAMMLSISEERFLDFVYVTSTY